MNRNSRGRFESKKDVPAFSRMESVVYAVALGCRSAVSLAGEWRISKKTAATILRNALRQGLVRRDSRGRFTAYLPGRGPALVAYIGGKRMIKEAG